MACRIPKLVQPMRRASARTGTLCDRDEAMKATKAKAAVVKTKKTSLHVGGLVTLVAGVHCTYVRDYYRLYCSQQGLSRDRLT